VDLNTPRWPQAPKGGFSEAWYVVASEPRAGYGLWLRSAVDLMRDGTQQFSLWGSWFERDRPERSFALKNFTDAAAIGRSVEALEKGECTGEVEGGGHALRWRLSFGAGPQGENFLPGWARPLARLRGNGFSFPHPAGTLTGAVEVDGRMIELNRVPAGQAHQWQRVKLPGWAWARCSAFVEDPDASIDLLDAIGPGGVRLPFITFRFRGEVHRFSELPWIALTQSRPAAPSWHFAAQDATLALDGVVHAQPSQMVAVHYPSSDGTRVFCNNTEIASMEVRVRTRAWSGASFRPEATLTSKSGACLEFCGRAPDPRVTNLLSVAAAQQKEAQPTGSVAS
jgi:hypothetical protein